MNCEVCQPILEEYFDGELKVRHAAEVRAHLAGCTACAAILAELRQEQELFARYERNLEVTPALWAGIEARIKAEKSTTPIAPPTPGWRDRLKGFFAMPHISPAFAAALVVLAIGLTVVVMSYLQSRSPGNPSSLAKDSNQPGIGNKNEAAPTPPQTGTDETGRELAEKPEHATGTNDGRPTAIAPKPAPQKQLAVNKPQAPPDPMKLVREAEQKYQAAIAILSQDVSRRRSQIDPTVLARFDSALADIDRTIQETRQIVRRNPDDPVALQYLLGAYAKKVDTLRAMSLD
ncbi:MAG TPA: anti-sigma factor [Blastocatellia bacterium]|nr:anti-sigma factor [Blastocatellia bacterium]